MVADKNESSQNIGINTLGRLVVRTGAATFEQVSECIEIQKSREASGISSRLGDILVEKGYLSEDRLQVLLTSQKKLARTNWADDKATGTFGAYDLLGTLGMFEDCDTFKARHRETGNVVLLRVMQPEIMQSEGPSRDMQHHVKNALLLRHPNIARIFSSGREAGRSYYALEYTDGVSLRHVISQYAPLACGLAAAIAFETATALNFAHQRHVCHQELRPSNILLTAAGHVMVIGMGLAREPVRSMESLIRSAGRMPLYIAPEQADGLENPDPRSDLFSLGAILFHMLAGKPPFEGDAVGDILLAMETGKSPTLPATVKEQNSELATLTEKLLAYDPAERFPDTASLVDALGALPREPIRLPD